MNIWASGVANPIPIVHFDGTWTAPNNGNIDSGFGGQSIWGSSSSDLYIAVANADGDILHSSDSGATWTPQQSGIIPHAVWGSGVSDVYAGGELGGLVHTIDSGTNWDDQSSNTDVAISETITGIWGSSANDVYAVGDEGQILRTTDGGQTWTMIYDYQFTMNAIWGSGPNDIWVATENQTVLHSTDGGHTWPEIQLSLGASYMAYKLRGSAADDLYLIAQYTGFDSHSKVWRSTDVGQTWHMVSGCGTLGVTDDNILDLWVAGTGNVFLVADDGAIFHIN
jgi:photosystem II stability/assembly factor-like uncharacterized protein